MKTAGLTFFLLIYSWFAAIMYSQVHEYWPTSGWQEKSPEDAGMDAAVLKDMEQTIISSMSYIDAFLVVKEGYLVYEQYFNDGYGKEDAHILCSATKSITGILIGIMLKQHYIVSLDQRITEFFPEYNGINSDPRINLLTIGHMLTFMAGLDNDEDEALGETDMIRYYLSREFIAEPGEQFKYATPASHVLSAIISKKTGMNARDFASVRLFQKLGITGYKWYSDAQGYTYGGHNSFFCPRDMLKIGYLYLNRGIWDGDTIVDPGYVETSTVAHSDGGSPHNEKYGYNWWITRNNDYDAYFAGGYGGQFIYVVPDLQLVVAITCNTDKHREDARFLINSHVVPAILNTSAVSDDKGIEPSGVRLFPNPATGGISIRFGTTVETSVSVFIADLSGRKIVSLIDDKIFKAGEHIFTSRFDLPPGCYITEVIIGSNKRHAKLFVSH